MDLLVGFEKETEITVVYHGSIFVLGSFLGCELHMRVYPCLTMSISIDGENTILRTTVRDHLRTTLVL